MDWLWNSLWHFLVNGLAGLPGFVLIPIAGAALGIAWGLLGWRGMLGMAIGILTLGAYRQGWKDRGDGKPPFVPVEVLKPPEPVKPKRPVLRDLFVRK